VTPAACIAFADAVAANRLCFAHRFCTLFSAEFWRQGNNLCEACGIIVGLTHDRAIVFIGVMDREKTRRSYTVMNACRPSGQCRDETCVISLCSRTRQQILFSWIVFLQARSCQPDRPCCLRLTRRGLGYRLRCDAAAWRSHRFLSCLVNHLLCRRRLQPMLESVRMQIHLASSHQCRRLGACLESHHLLITVQ
jgi:hypothetical protein